MKVNAIPFSRGTHQAILYSDRSDLRNAPSVSTATIDNALRSLIAATGL